MHTRSPEAQTPSMYCLSSGHANPVHDQKLTGLRRTEAVDPEDDAKEGDWGIPPGGGGWRSTLMIS